MSTPASSGDENTLLGEAVAAFAFSTQDIADMAHAIYLGRLDAANAAFDATYATLDMDDTPDIPDSFLSAMAVAANQSARQIATTYRDDMRAVAVVFITAWKTKHGSLDGCGTALSTFLVSWCHSREQWKAQQIANAETGAGNTAAVAYLIEELLRGAFSFSGDIGDYEVAVEPNYSSTDACAEYAGQSYPLDLADTLPDFPIHPNCIHRIVIRHV